MLDLDEPVDAGLKVLAVAFGVGGGKGHGLQGDDVGGLVRHPMERSEALGDGLVVWRDAGLQEGVAGQGCDTPLAGVVGPGAIGLAVAFEAVHGPEDGHLNLPAVERFLGGGRVWKSRKHDSRNRR